MIKVGLFCSLIKKLIFFVPNYEEKRPTFIKKKFFRTFIGPRLPVKKSRALSLPTRYQHNPVTSQLPLGNVMQCIPPKLIQGVLFLSNIDFIFGG